VVGIGIIEKRSKLRKINGTRFVGFWGGITRFGILASCSAASRALCINFTRRFMVHGPAVHGSMVHLLAGALPIGSPAA